MKHSTFRSLVSLALSLVFVLALLPGFGLSAQAANVSVSTEIANPDEILIPAATLKDIYYSMANTSQFKINFPAGTIALDLSDTRDKLQATTRKDTSWWVIRGVEPAPDEALKVSFIATDEAALNADQQATLSHYGDFGGSVQQLFSFSASIAGISVDDSSWHGTTAVIPYKLSADQNWQGVVVYYLKEDGYSWPVDSSYNGKTLRFDIWNPGVYAVIYINGYTETCDRDKFCFLNQYTDLDPTAWYHDSIHWAIQWRMMSGLDENQFGPDEAVTGEEVSQILQRLTLTKRPLALSDLDAPVTREQLITALYYYVMEDDAITRLCANTDLASFSDATDVTEYALRAMRWSVGTGLITGRDSTTLNPKSIVTRAEAATILLRAFKADLI